MPKLDYQHMFSKRICDGDITPADRELYLQIKKMCNNSTVHNDNNDDRSALDMAIEGAKKFPKINLRSK